MSGRSLVASEDGRYKFTGKERDASEGLDYFGARYYDSWNARWLQVDPLADDHPNESPYVYCNNNPVNIVDDDGMEGWETINGQNVWVLGEVNTYAYPDNSATTFAALTVAATIDPEPITRLIFTGVAAYYGIKLINALQERVKADAAKTMTNTTYPLNDNLPTLTINLNEEQTNTEKNAAQKVPNLNGKTEEEVEKELKDAGFIDNGKTAYKGYHKWYNPDGSKIQIRPDGEVIRYGPKNGAKYAPRYDANGEKTPSHNTGERIIK